MVQFEAIQEGTITGLLEDARGGDREAFDRLVPLINEQLRRVARGHLRSERSGHTLQPTALIHEVYIRLLKGAQPEWESRTHFFSIASHLMRQILTDHARARAADKRGWSFNVCLENASNFAIEKPSVLVELNDALEALGRIDPRKSRAIDFRYFGGLEIEEIASVLDISPATVRRDLRMGEAWLRREMNASSQTLQSP